MSPASCSTSRPPGLTPRHAGRGVRPHRRDQPRGRVGAHRRAERPKALRICHRGYVLDNGTDAYTGTGQNSPRTPGHRAVPGLVGPQPLSRSGPTRPEPRTLTRPRGCGRPGRRPRRRVAGRSHPFRPDQLILISLNALDVGVRLPSVCTPDVVGSRCQAPSCSTSRTPGGRDSGSLALFEERLAVAICRSRCCRPRGWRRSSRRSPHRCRLGPDRRRRAIRLVQSQ